LFYSIVEFMSRSRC